MRIDEITTAEFQGYVKRGATAILPIGATESHGPHLPLGTDTFQPEYIAHRVSEIMGTILVAPTLPYGQHSTGKNVPGTIAISFDSLRSVVTDILGSLIRHGLKRIVVISGHAGTSHLTAITEACRETAEKTETEIFLVSDFHVAAEFKDIKNDGHAGLAETSRMLSIRPDLVKDIRPKGTFRSFGHKVVGDASACLPDGLVGDTSGSTAELGDEMNDFVVKEIVKMLS